jgi:sec-independent protein translocase protein TatC
MAITALKDQLPKTAEARLPFMSHLKELRDRLLYSVIAVGAGLILGLIFGNKILELLMAPAPAGLQDSLVAIEILENMSVYFKVSLTAGVIVAMPFLVYQLFAFTAPGLTSKEKRMIFSILPAIVFMFLCGVAFAYFAALPPALTFLFNFNSDIALPQIRISNYVDLVTRLLVVIGLVFETPIIIMGLARLGIVSPQWLAARRRMWVVLAFVLAAIITPTFDPLNQTIIAVPLILLLELGILLSRLVYKKREQPADVKK